MLFNIHHKTELTYSERISESVMEVRLTPRSDGQQTLRHFHIAVGPEARVSSHVDWQGNTVHQFSIVAFHDRVTIVSNALVETHPSAPDLSLVKDPVKGGPVNHRLLDCLAFQGPVQRDPRLDALAQRVGLHEAKTVADAIRIVSGRARGALEYRRGITNSATTVSEALDHGVGVCQDFAHVGLALLRSIGVPCRYVSGYLHRSDLPEVETHAWCEAYAPSAGWIGFDPTHGELVGDHHVAVATGRSYADVPPNRGVYRGEAEERISAAVAIRPVAESGPEPFVGPYHVASYSDGQGFAPGAYALEQQRQAQQQDRRKAQIQQQRQQQQ
jgi:transglutaminase-like putative cysteine protease